MSTPRFWLGISNREWLINFTGDITLLLISQYSHCLSCWPPSPCDRLSRSPRRARHHPRLLRGLRPTLMRFLDSKACGVTVAMLPE